MTFHSHPLLRQLCVLFIVLNSVVCGDRNATAMDSPTREAITDAWKKRELACGAVKCEYSIRWINMPNFNDAKEKTEYARTTRFWIDGRQMRYEVAGPGIKQGKLAESHIVSSYDGNRSATLSDRNEEIRYPQGFVHPGDSCDGIPILDTRPITWTFFATDPDRALFSLDSLTLASEKVEINGAQCLQAEVRLESTTGKRVFPGNVERFFLDPSKGYSLVRYTFGTETTPFVQIDCSYKQSAASGAWLPDAWTTWRFSADGQPQEVGTCIVDVMETSAKFAEGDFRITFQPGTVVSDLTQHLNVGRTGTYDYIVLADGSERQITWEERFADHERLMNTRTGEAGISKPRPQFTLLWVINGIGFTIVAAIFVVKHFFVRSRQTETSGSGNSLNQ